jgi:hypothetical protein
MFFLSEEHMKKPTVGKESAKSAESTGEPRTKGKDALKPCDKAFHPETARLKDSDEACDDSVR